MSQVGIPGKQPLRWRLSCKRFIWQCPWNKQLGKGIERSRMDRRRSYLQCSLSGGLSQPSREF